MNGLQCPRLLWHTLNAKEEMPEHDIETKFRFEQGHLIEKYAHRLFPGIINAEWKKNVSNLINMRMPLSEIMFEHENLKAKADILNPVDDNQWDIIEIKSSTSVKSPYYPDMAFQKFCYERWGLKIRKCILMHLNNEYIRKGDIEPEKLFVEEDITEDVKEHLQLVEDKVTEMFSVIKGDEPKARIGPHCSDPYTCPLIDECWEGIPENNIFNLYWMGEKAWKLFDDGIISTDDIPDEYRLTPKQEIQINCEKSGKPHIDKEQIKKFLDSLEYPLYFLDFETFSTAIPIIDGIGPYHKVPFQFSLHIINSPDSEPEHHSYLSEIKDPRTELFHNLKELLKDRGSIIAYNAGFEIGVIRKLCEFFNDKWQVEHRFIDLIAPFKNFHYYHPSQKGSASLKKVLPAITGKGYDDLEIKDGSTAYIEYLRVMLGDASEEEKQKVFRQLDIYCTLDTQGMVDIIEKLYKLM